MGSYWYSLSNVIYRVHFDSDHREIAATDYWDVISIQGDDNKNANDDTFTQVFPEHLCRDFQGDYPNAFATSATLISSQSVH